MAALVSDQENTHVPGVGDTFDDDVKFLYIYDDYDTLAAVSGPITATLQYGAASLRMPVVLPVKIDVQSWPAGAGDRLVKMVSPRATLIIWPGTVDRGGMTAMPLSQPS